MSCNIYTMDKQPKSGESSPILYISESTYENDWHSMPHAHTFMEMFFVLNGEGSFEVDGHRFPIRKNDLIILTPNVRHTEYSSEKNPVSYIVIDTNAIEIGDVNKQRYYLYNLSDYKEEVRFCFKTILHEIQRKPQNYDLICRNLFFTLMGYMSRITDHKMVFAPTKKQKISNECRFIEQYINEHFFEDITLEKLSELTYLNKYYLTHLFKEYCGQSPINYLINLRIARAKFLLESTNLTITQVAISTGFSSTSYFSQQFTKKVGMSPNQYRKEQKVDR